MITIIIDMNITAADNVGVMLAPIDCQCTNSYFGNSGTNAYDNGRVSNNISKWSQICDHLTTIGIIQTTASPCYHNQACQQQRNPENASCDLSKIEERHSYNNQPYLTSLDILISHQQPVDDRCSDMAHHQA